MSAPAGAGCGKQQHGGRGRESPSSEPQGLVAQGRGTAVGGFVIPPGAFLSPRCSWMLKASLPLHRGSAVGLLPGGTAWLQGEEGALLGLPFCFGDLLPSPPRQQREWFGFGFGLVALEKASHGACCFAPASDLGSFLAAQAGA